MLSAAADFIAQEALAHGARPAVRVVLAPHYWPDGVDAEGDFVSCSFVAPDRIQGDCEGFVAGSWISDPVFIDLQFSPAAAVITFTLNEAGNDCALYYRAAPDLTTLAAESWTAITSGETLDLQSYYQFKLTLAGFRCWAEDGATGDRDLDLEWLAELISDYETEDGEWDFEQEFDLDQFYDLVNAAAADADWDLDLAVLGDEFTAWAVDAESDDYVSYAGEGDGELTYLENIVLLGELIIITDIEQAGSLVLEAPESFDDLVAGEHSGLILNNRQGSFATGAFVPAPRYSPNKSSFLFAGEDWYDKLIKIQIGYATGGWFAGGFGSGAWLGDDFTDWITLFLGRLKSWGPVTRAIDEDGVLQPHTVEIYAANHILDCLQKRICLPAEDGTPAPRTYGEFLVEAEPVAGWTPVAPVKEAFFEDNDFSELDLVSGAASIIAPGMNNSGYAFRTSTTGAGQSAYGVLSLAAAGDLFLTGTLRFSTIPATLANRNLRLFEIRNSAGAVIDYIEITSGGQLYEYRQGPGSSFDIRGYEDVPLDFAYWYAPGNAAVHGFVKFWINGEEIIDYHSNGFYLEGTPLKVFFGATTSGTAETWDLDFDNLRLFAKYYNHAFRVTGGPFADIGSVFIDKVAQPDYKVDDDGYDQTITRYPAYGLVEFNNPEGAYVSFDPDFKIPSNVMVRVVNTLGGEHALAILEDLFAEAGLTAYLDATALAAAYLAAPDDYINARFEGGKFQRHELRDVASLGLPIADAIKEICSRCLYWIYMDAESIRIVPYTGTPAADGDVVLALESSNLREAVQVIDLNDINEFVTVIYGWYDRNPTLHYVAGTQAAGGQGTGLDFSWNAPVACESYAVVKAKTDLLLKFLSAREIIDPARMTLKGARLEIMDPVSVEEDHLNDAATNYWVTRKEVNLDLPRETYLRLERYLGEI